MKSPDQDILILIRAIEDGRRILREFIEPGPHDAMRTVERLLIKEDGSIALPNQIVPPATQGDTIGRMNEKPHMILLDRNDVVHALDRTKRLRWEQSPGFGCGRIVNWKTDKPKRIFREWRQLSDATIAAPSTNAPKKSSWYRTPVTHPVKSAGLG